MDETSREVESAGSEGVGLGDGLGDEEEPKGRKERQEERVLWTGHSEGSGAA